MSELIKFNPDYNIHPGVYVSDYLDEKKISISDFSKYSGCSEDLVNDIINEKADITDELATKISLETNTPVTFWKNLQFNYNNF